jgi:UDP-2,3-diacylglucosamine hydrolase
VAYVFASDLHLSSENPEKLVLFESFLARAAKSARALYLLGDVFEIWLGDDDDSEPHPQIIRALRDFTASGCELFVMRGNRDFLFGPAFANAVGATLLPDWYTLDLFGNPTLLTHGDLLCTKDVQYQEFRKYVRDPANQKSFLACSLDERRKIAASTRSGTKASMLEKDEIIMDVEQVTVEQIMGEYNVTQLIHGHTHRPDSHSFESDTGISLERHVLGDWYGIGSVLIGGSNGVIRMSAGEFIDAPQSVFN